MHPLIGSILAQAVTTAPIIREGVRTRPRKGMTANQATPALKEAMGNRIEKIGGTNIPPNVELKGYAPQNLEQVLANPLMLGGNQRVYGKHSDGLGLPNVNDYRGDRIFYNEHASPEVLAHEMGHTITATTDTGKLIRTLRDNPKLSMALAAASGLVPLGAAMLTPGDDDYDEAMLGVTALAAPKLIDEGLATKNALAIMEDAGMRATLGQRGRLAGGLLSYVAAGLGSAALATAVGNQFDENVPAQ